jgi:hypothetical protein
MVGIMSKQNALFIAAKLIYKKDCTFLKALPFKEEE